MRKLTVEEINEALAPRGIVCVKYGGNVSVKSTFRCEHGHEWSARANNVKSTGSGCPHCAGKAPLTTEGINKDLISRGIVCIDYGGSAKAKSTFKCKHGHEWKTTVNSVKDGGKGCPHCRKN